MHREATGHLSQPYVDFLVLKTSLNFILPSRTTSSATPAVASPAASATVPAALVLLGAVPGLLLHLLLILDELDNFIWYAQILDLQQSAGCAMSAGESESVDAHCFL